MEILTPEFPGLQTLVQGTEIKEGAIPLGGAKLKDKERQILKDAFRNFNSSFSDIHAKCSKMTIPDEEIKTGLRKEVGERLVEKYSHFRRTYDKIVFTKNLNKYLLYTDKAIEEEIENLFN